MNFIKQYYPEIIISLLWLILLWVNYTPFAFLTGWDSVQSDLSPGLGVKRAFFSVWEQYQSFGLVAGMGHAADLVRALVIWLLSFLLPDWSLRYVLHMSMVLFAGLGALQLLKFLDFGKEKKSIAVVGALFYMFNFAAIQMVYLPYESFTIFFGTLPWLLWVFLKSIKEPKPLWKKPQVLLLFIVINFLATSSFQAQQLFVVYMLLLGVMTVGLWIPLLFTIRQKAVLLLLNAMVAFVIIGITNSFWLAPQVYFLVDNGSVVKEAKMNQLVTDDVFFSNKDKGDVVNFLSFQGFLYDRQDGHQKQLFQPWKTHRESIVVLFITATLAAVMLCGLLMPTAYRFGFLAAMIFIMIGLLLHTPPFEQINALLRANPFINQVFRSPFTKFSIPFALIASYFFAAGVAFLIEHLPLLLQRKTHRKNMLQYTSRVLVVVALALILFQAFPAFKGNYIAKSMRVGIPQPYFSFMHYMQKQDPSLRITLLPDYTFWGWFYTLWGYNGSGFIWYGVPQPFVSRTFDVWSKSSESYYWEVKQASESEDPAALVAVLQKYNISYILYDKSFSPVVSSTKAIQYDRLDTLLTNNPYIRKEKQWDYVTLYRVSQPQQVHSFVSLFERMPNIGPAVPLTNRDTAYLQYGTYQTNTKKAYSVYVPFLDLTSQTNLPHKRWAITEHADTISLTTPISKDMQTLQLATTSGEVLEYLYNDNQPKEYVIPYTITKTDTMLSVTFPKITIDTYAGNTADASKCLGSRGSLTTDKSQNRILLETSDGGAGCFAFKDEFLDQRYGYLLKVKNTNSSGQRLFFYVLDETKEQPYIEDRFTSDTAYYILGSKYNQGFGYSFSFQNTSYPTLPASNALENLSVYAIPYEVIKELELTNSNNPVTKAQSLPAPQVQERNYYRYEVSIPKQSQTANTTLVLYQSFDAGWKAYETKGWASNMFPILFGKEIKEHVLINNWANGWNLTNQKHIVLLFWPQYLQYAGLFGLLAILLGIILFRKRLSKE